MARTARSSFNAARLVGGVALVAVLASAALSTWAQPGQGMHGGPGMHSDSGMMGMPMQARMVERMLDSVNATADQRAQIKQITERAAGDMKAQHQAGRALHEQGAKLFTQPTIDAGAAEALRQQMMQLHDQASRRMLQTMLDIGKVLTPEQRQQLTDRMATRRDMMQRHMQERQSLDVAPAKR